MMKIQEQTKIAIAQAVAAGDKTKAQIAKDFGVSRDSVRRYGNKFADKVKAQVKTNQAKVTKTKAKNADKDGVELTDNQKKILATYYKQKGTLDKVTSRVGHTGRAPKGVKTIRYIAMEVIEAHANAGTLVKANKADIIAEIAKAAEVELKTARQYFSGHKKLFGDWQDQ